MEDNKDNQLANLIKQKTCTSCGIIKTVDNTPKTRTGKCKECHNKDRRKPKGEPKCKDCNVLITEDNKRTGKQCKSCYNKKAKEARINKQNKLEAIARADERAQHVIVN